MAAIEITRKGSNGAGVAGGVGKGQRCKGGTADAGDRARA